MTLLVTGASGLLGRYLVAAVDRRGLDARFVGLESVPDGELRFVRCDLTRRDDVARLLDAVRPTAVLHAAAMTDVDACEDDPERAALVNAFSSELLAEYGEEAGARLVYVSTDSVFDGSRGRYAEDDAPAPLNAYATSKVAGERAVATSPNHLIVRTNFFARDPRRVGLAEWIIRQLAADREITGFADVVFSPLYAADLARLLVELTQRDETGLLHLGARDAVSKLDFARLLAAVYELDDGLIREGRLGDAVLRAPRPADTSLDASLAASILDERLPSVEESIERMRAAERHLPYGRQTIDDSDVTAVVEVLRGDWLTQGPAIEAFEEALATSVGARHAVAFSSGTAALHAACAVAGLGEGDEVLTSPFSFAASANCARYVGAMPRFVDIDGSTLVTPSADFAAATGPATRAVIPVHYAGRPVDLGPLAGLRDRGVLVIEDAAHALGAVGPHGPVGNCATSDMACFSFHPVKAVTTGEGGAVTTNDPDLARRLRSFRTHGIVRGVVDGDGGWYYEIDQLGMNYRITDIQCSLGLAQLRRLDLFLSRRNEIAALYAELLAESEIELPPIVDDGELHGYHLVVALLPHDVDRRRVFDAMRAAGIGVQVHYIPIYWHPYYSRLGFERGLCPEAERAYGRCLSLPVYPKLADTDVERVVAQLRAAVEVRRVPT